MTAAVQRPVVAVIGTTGVGKSQLAVALAQSLAKEQVGSISKGVVLSADSMQLYKGLDVITNKVTKDEMGDVEHWGLNIVTPGQGGSWEVGKWCGEAFKKIESLTEETLPIICGGTHYFIQHFLFPPNELSFERDPDEGFDVSGVRWKPPGPHPPVPSGLASELKALLDTFWMADPCWPQGSPEQAGPSTRPTVNEDANLLSLHNLLAAVDPNEAGRWHWRDGRKVRRGLERWWEKGTAIEKQQEGQSSQPKGRRARFRTLIFWVYEALPNLAPRLDGRVDKMIENGLLREIAEMRDIARGIYGTDNAVDHTEGIFQSIGYKEFAALRLPQEDPSSDPLFPSMVALTKSKTNQYARSQIRWIKKQLLPALREARSLGGEVEVFIVPGGAAGEGPAIQAMQAFLKRQSLPDWRSTGHPDAVELLKAVYDAEGSARVPDTAERQVINSQQICDICSEPGKPYSVLSAAWDSHETGRYHKRRLEKVSGAADRKIAEQLAMREVKRAQREALRAGRSNVTNDA